MWHKRNIAQTFDMQHNFGCSNLVVSGSSFTYNNSDQDSCTWPYYLRDLGGFERVYDTSLPGAGNAHIATSLQWSLENHSVDPADSMVVVMWAFNNTDDFIVDSTATKQYPFHYHYTRTVQSGIVGGAENYRTQRPANLSLTPNVDQLKSPQSRAVENYLAIVNLKALHSVDTAVCSWPQDQVWLCATMILKLKTISKHLWPNDWPHTICRCRICLITVCTMTIWNRICFTPAQLGI
jgi:hypothetical protein